MALTTMTLMATRFEDDDASRDHYNQKEVRREQAAHKLATNEIRPPAAGSRKVVNVNGRGERIRTSDLSVPNRAHYQAVLRPELMTAEKADEHSIDGQTSGQVQPSSDFKNCRIAARA